MVYRVKKLINLGEKDLNFIIGIYNKDKMLKRGFYMVEKILQKRAKSEVSPFFTKTEA